MENACKDLPVQDLVEPEGWSGQFMKPKQTAGECRHNDRDEPEEFQIPPFIAVVHRDGHQRSCTLNGTAFPRRK